MVDASTRLSLRVMPGARRTEVVGRHGSGWKVRVAAPPEGGRANTAVCRLLAETLELPRRSVSVVSGRATRDKVVDVSGLGPNEAERRLARATAAERRPG